ncbi:predicted protein [Plenodomus lingam JN3]|uniref:Predicted protein n=1 Tax=Leptosphaeria maculans (strain JN3 / isolate v23.1.3 / race Av1-4-5-6-7-8) TaxID=985895 RepID=E5A4F8_LEPMJ|nr:predicted protein [Plenodomus lingam JN3]CBX98503.1 predicted protein [Plenodomus lingam JN3]
MASFQGRADVLSVNVAAPVKRGPLSGPIFSLDIGDASGNHHAFQSLFARDVAPSDCNDPAQKRRKITNGTAVSIHQVETDSNKSVVLAKVSLDLNSRVPAASLHSSQNFAAVSLERFDINPRAPNAFRIVLCNIRSRTGVEVIATTSTDFLESAKPHLAIAASLLQKKPAFRAVFCHCRIASPAQGYSAYRLEVEIRWSLGISVVEDPAVTAHYMREDLQLLSKYFRDGDVEESREWALSDFYDAVHIPPFDLEISPRIRGSLMETTLYPFQQRAVDWLLRREGVTFSSLGELETFTEPAPPSSFRSTQDVTGRQCHVSNLRGKVVASLDDAKDDPS